MNTHHLKFENWDFADDINEKKKKMTMMITFEKKTKKNTRVMLKIYISIYPLPEQKISLQSR